MRSRSGASGTNAGYIDGELALRRCASEAEPPSEVTICLLSSLLRITSRTGGVSGEQTLSEIAEVLGDMGMGSYGEAIDCGACGYGSCRDFARAAVAMGVPCVTCARVICVKCLRTGLPLFWAISLTVCLLPIGLCP